MSKTEHIEREQEEPDAFQQKTISENTPIKLSLLLAIVAMCAAGLVSGVWWASRTSAQLEGIMSAMAVDRADAKITKNEIVELQSQMKVLNASGSPQLQVVAGKVQDLAERIRTLEVTGSPALIPRVTALELSLTKLREDFMMHKAEDERTLNRIQNNTK